LRAEYISSPLHEEEEEEEEEESEDDEDDDDDEATAAAAEVLMPSVSSKSPFPPPPEFYKLYIKKKGNKDDDVAPPLPPLLPEQGETYETFGATHADPSKLLAPELLVDDPDFPFQKLYAIVPHDDGGRGNEKKRLNAKTEIQKLNRETLDRFVALANDLQNAPSRANERIEEIALLYNNLHHLLNTIRPLQARETVAFILKRQIEEKTQALQTLRESLK